MNTIPSNSTIVSMLKHSHKEIYETIVKSCGDSLPFTHQDIRKIWDLVDLDSDRTKFAIALSLHLYSPESYKGVSVRRGLAVEIARIKNVTREAISKQVPQVVNWYKYNKAFKSKTDKYLEILKGEGNEQ
ncbi:hypothetical protein ACS126_09845 [Sphingobacterium lactis]|uniref:hypothetical protein n=1 Tax=Sphingobacterium lactis TaxID=797291 RepID=UPI003EC8EE3C